MPECGKLVHCDDRKNQQHEYNERDEQAHEIRNAVMRIIVHALIRRLLTKLFRREDLLQSRLTSAQRLLRATTKHDTYLSDRTMELADTSFNQRVETRPFASLAQRYQIFLALDELFFNFVAQRLHIPEPCPEAAVVVVRGALKCVERAGFDKDFIYPFRK
jgi:hypothetical protein